MSEFEKKTIN